MTVSSVIVLITGANSGIGYATTKAIVSASSMYHVIMASRSPEAGQEALSSIQASGVKGSLSCVQLDVTDESSIEDAVRHVTTHFGRLDVLVNNAGVASKDPSLKRQLETTLNTNVIGPALVTDAFEPLLLRSKRPYLLHISSGLGSLSMASDPNSTHYKAPWMTYRTSKAGLNMMAIEHSKRLREHGVKTFAVCPGLVRSNLRGKAEEQISADGRAGDPMVSGRFILSLIEGERDGDVGKLVNKDGIYSW